MAATFLHVAGFRGGGGQLYWCGLSVSRSKRGKEKEKRTFKKRSREEEKEEIAKVEERGKVKVETDGEKDCQS